MAYTTISKSTLHHDCNLYQANGSGKTISGMGFKPDMIWTKNRSSASYIPAIVDAVRGGTKKIFTCNTDAEATDSNAVTSFTSDGYVFGSSGSFNYSTDNYVNWCWKANGAGSVDSSSGSISATVSANATAGFSIIRFTNPSSGNFTIPHGLGVAPDMLIFKCTGGSQSWFVLHKDLASYTDRYLRLQTTASEITYTMQSQAPTSTLLYLNSGGVSNGNADTICYAYASKTGYSRFGSYTGTGNADGTFVYCGFKPKFYMLKRIDSADWWGVWDNKRLGYNPNNYHMRINETSYTEASKVVDQLSNGFKIRETDTAINASGGNYLYMAFGQSLVGSNDIPCTAR
tara:strand:- start:1230 stop:2261 length:1032 start_codon:yes stop_codon:yes gene_type:complete